MWRAVDGVVELHPPGSSTGYTYAIWDADGSRVLTADRDGVAKLWDARNGMLLRWFDCESSLQDPPLWTKDGLRIVTYSQNRTMQIWNAHMGELLRRIPDVDAYTLSNNEEWLIADIRQVAQATFWDIATGEQLLSEKRSDRAVFDATGSRIATLEGSSVHIYNTAGRREILPQPIDARGASEVEWLEGSDNLLTSHWDGWNGAMQVWNSRTGELLARLTDEDVKFFYPMLLQRGDGRRIITVDSTGAIRFWDMSTQPVTLRTVPNVTGADRDHKQQNVLTWGRDGVVALWDAASARRVLELKTGGGAINSAVISEDGTRIFVKTVGAASIWDRASAKRILSLPDIASVCKDYDAWFGSALASLVGNDNVLHIFEGMTGKELHTRSDVKGCSWNKQRDRLAIWAGRSPIHILDAYSGAEVTTARTELRDIFDGSWSRSGTRLIVRAYSGTALVDAVSGTEIMHLENASMAWSATQVHILVNAPNAWEVRDSDDGHLVLNFPSAVIGVWSPEGERVAIADETGTVLVWDIASDTRVELKGHALDSTRTYGFDIKWSGDGSRLLTRDGDRILRVWDTFSGALIQMYPNPIAAGININRIMIDDTGSVVMFSSNSDYTVWNVDRNQEILHISRTNNIMPDNQLQRLLIIEEAAVSIVPSDPTKMMEEACTQTPRNLSWEEWVRIRPNDRYEPTCPGKLIPPDVIAAVGEQAGDLVRGGKVDEAKRLVDGINGWLRASNQFERWGITLDTQVPAQQAGGRWRESAVSAALRWPGQATSMPPVGVQAAGRN